MTLPFAFPLYQMKKEQHKTSRATRKQKLPVFHHQPFVLPSNTEKKSSSRPDSKKSSLPPSGRQTPGSENRSELNYSRTLIQNLVQDNKSLHQNLQDFKSTIDTVIYEYRQLTQNLASQRLKSQKLTYLEKTVQQEKQKTSELQEANAALKEKYLKTLEIFRQSAFEISQQTRQDQLIFDHLVLENNHLKEIMGISKLDEEVAQAINSALIEEESALNQISEGQYRKMIQLVRNKKRVPTHKTKKYLLQQ